jgi:hypothetical protein
MDVASQTPLQITNLLYNIMPQMGFAYWTYSTIPSTIIHANLKSLEPPKSVQNGARNRSITVSAYSKAALVGNPFRKSIRFSVLSDREAAKQLHKCAPLRQRYQFDQTTNGGHDGVLIAPTLHSRALCAT